MILKNIVVALTFTLVCLNGISGVSYSQVYVQSGSDARSVDSGYGAPAYYTSPQIAQLSAPPIGSVLPLEQAASFIQPCVSPCIVSNQAAVPSNAGLLSYKESVPVVVAAPRNTPTNYEYAYVIYDDNTGYQNAPPQPSNGGVLQGQYSLIQPYGYVQYTADDLRGFNLVIPNVTPELQGNKQEYPNPCNEGDHEPLKEKPNTNFETAKEPQSPEEPESGINGKPSSKEQSEEPSLEKAPSEEKPNSKEETSGEKPSSKENPSEEKPSNKEKSSGEKSDQVPSAKKPSSQDKSNSGEEIISKEEPEDANKPDEPKNNAVEPKGQPKIEKPPGHSAETSIEHAEHPEDPKKNEGSKELTQLAVSEPAGNLVSYNDLVKCIQAAMQKNSVQSSPLTYILLPAKPC